MSNNTEPSSQQSCHLSEECLAAKGQLQRCIQMLKSARNDNEKMASLLLFTHLMKNNESLTCDSSEVFDAIGARFIVRLLNSKNVPEGCPPFMYKSLALSILASFTEQDLLFHPLIISNLCAIVEVLSVVESPTEAQEMLKDSIKILLMFSRTYTGCKHLLENNCIPVILQAALNNPDTLFEVLKGILHHIPSETWNHNGSELSNLLELLSRKFAEYQDMEKFTTCEKLLVLLTSLCESHIENHDVVSSGATWKGNIRRGLRDILQSRCKITYKYTALQMAANMIELFSVEWTLVSDQKSLNMTNTQFWFLLLSITKTEVKMILESGDNDEIQAKSAIIVACYRIIEKTIEFLITDPKCGWSFGDDLVLQMHSILLESFDCIIQFLIQLGTSPDTTQCYRRPIVLATIRVLYAWLSEETNSLSDGVSKVLPILLHWARSSLKEGNESLPTGHDSKAQHEIISYLLPPLCHLSADETFCAILIKEEAHLLLASVFNQLWQTQQKEPQEYPSSLINLCNVFLNFSVLEVELIKTNQVFQDILNCIMVSLPQMVHSNQVTLTTHFTLLGFILFRHRCPLTQTNLSTLETGFLQSGIEFLKQAQMSVCETPQSNFGVSLLKEWDNISELWFLSVQNLVACAKVVDPVKKTLLSSGWVEETKTWLQCCEGNNEKIFTELKSALLPIASFN